jgi:hypothetical protein
MSKELTHAQISAAANANDRERQHTGHPKSGSATPAHKLSTPQSNGAGSASVEKTERANGLSVILGGGSPAIAGSSNVQSTEVKSRTPNKEVQRARNEQVRRENGGEDTTGRKKK